VKTRSLRGSARSSRSPALRRDGGDKRHRLRAGPRCRRGVTPGAGRRYFRLRRHALGDVGRI